MQSCWGHNVIYLNSSSRLSARERGQFKETHGHDSAWASLQYEAVNDLYDAFCERYEVLFEGNIDIYDFSGDYAPIKERYTEARDHYGEALRALDVEDPDVLPDSAAEAESESE